MAVWCLIVPLGMIFGRPAAILDDYVKLPLPSNLNEDATPDAMLDPCASVSVAFFTATVQLMTHLRFKNVLAKNSRTL